MPPKAQEKSKALTVLRRAGTDSVMSMARIGAIPGASGVMLRMFLRNIHLSVMSRKEEDLEINKYENSYAPGQRDGEEPVMKFVRVAMKPPTTHTDRNRFDESISWEASSKKWKGGLSARNKKKEEIPPFILNEVPYDEWRKHYAKDRLGRYRGTEAPAENCILLPEDEEKWRSNPPQSEAEQSTQSEVALPEIEPITRSATLPITQVLDPELSMHPEQASAIPTQKEEAVFIESDGHMASQIVEEPRSGFASPTSPASPITLSPPASPISKRD